MHRNYSHCIGTQRCNVAANSTPWAQKDKGSGETSGPKNGQARIFEEFLELKNEANPQNCCCCLLSLLPPSLLLVVSAACCYPACCSVVAASISHCLCGCCLRLCCLCLCCLLLRCLLLRCLCVYCLCLCACCSAPASVLPLFSHSMHCSGKSFCVPGRT